jgi:tRNA-modifying protein YgfZ
MLNFYRVKQDYLKFEGTERLDLINRLSTNEVASLEKSKGIKTILTSDKGRFVDLITLYNFGDFIFAACSFNNSKNVLAHLDKYTIMDDFKPTDMAGTHETVLFYGDDAAKFAKKVFNVDTAAFSNNDFAFYNIDNHDSIIAGNDDAFGGFHFIYSSGDKDFWHEKIFNGINAKEVSDTEYDTARIKLGIPAFGKEMSDLTNPLECGLNKYVSFTKGCYIGQEVIARLDAYDKISKHMVGIKFDVLPDKATLNELKITTDSKECGFVTSTVKSDTHGNIGLGFVKTIFLDYNKGYKIKHNNNFTECKLVKLPFNQSLPTQNQ